jgi:hypothetical protein
MDQKPAIWMFSVITSPQQPPLGTFAVIAPTFAIAKMQATTEFETKLKSQYPVGITFAYVPYLPLIVALQVVLQTSFPCHLKTLIENKQFDPNEWAPRPPEPPHIIIPRFLAWLKNQSQEEPSTTPG